MNTHGIRVGTIAHHKLGDISRPKGDFFFVDSEDEENYIGRWITGYGFVNVRFPKDTTRELNESEKDWLADKRAVIA